MGQWLEDIQAIVCNWNKITAAAHYHMTGNILQNRRNRRHLSLVDVVSNLDVVTVVTFVRQCAMFGESFNLLKPTSYVMHHQFNPVKTKRRLLYLMTESVPRSKHFSSRL